MKSIGKRFCSWVPLVFLASASWISAAGTATEPDRMPPFERIVEDVPGRLVLELSPSGFAFDTAADQGLKVSCAGCHQSGRPGAPDLPVYRFDVLTGPDAPVATLRILDSETRTVAIGVAPYPHTPTPRSIEYHPDAKLYREAGAAVARLLEARRLRGAPIRGVEVPLSLWSEDGKTLTLLKRVRVSLEFGRTLGSPAANRLEGAFRSAVKNPVGGPYLYASSRAKALRKTGAAKADIGKTFVKLRVGDRNVEGLDEDRVYALAFSDLIRISGASGLNGVKIGDLKLYTGINDTLPQKMDSVVPTGTLRQIPMEVVDANGPGTFDEGDTLKFFGHGTSIWKRLPTETTRIRFEFSADPYSYENYYYLGFLESGEAALRMREAPALAPTGQPVPSSHAYLRAEKDLATACCDPSNVKDEESGLEWHWFWKGRCDGPDTTVTLTRAQLASDKTRSLPDIAQGDSVDSVFVGLYVYESRSENAFTVFHGGGGNTLSRYPDSVSPGTWFVLPSLPDGAPAFQLDSVEWRGSQKRFDGYTVSYRRNHVFSGDPIWIFPSETGKRVSYSVKSQAGAGLKCLRVENGVATSSIPVDGQGVFTDSLGLYSDARYYLYADAVPLAAAAMEMEASPSQGTAIQDLATGDNENPDYLIITARPLLAQAVQLRNYRNQDSRTFKVKTSVVLVEDIYRKYSSGRMSPAAIRDFLRQAYSEWGGKGPGANPLKYVLLYGDGHYDYRNIVASGLKIQPPNLVPPHEYILERDPIASDDFYGVLDPGASGFIGGMMDLAIGRLPLQTPEEADNYLQKIKDYEDPSKAGDWRGRVVMAADDGTQRGRNVNHTDPIQDGHTTYSDRLGKKISLQQKGTTVDKVYLLDYPMNSAYHKPEAAKDLLTFINRGAITVNYVGHGADDQWADEVLLQTSDALSRMQNAGKTPMVNAFSCTVGRFESLKKEGMSELFVKTKSVGAIGAVSATRESYPGPNLELAEAFYVRVFPPDSSGLVVTAGEALRDAKNASQSGFNNLNDSKYQLLGEPVLLVRKPQLNVSLSQALDTIKALDCDTIRGRIEGGSGSGFVNIKIVAGSVYKSYDLPFNLMTQEVDKRGNILFERTLAYKDFAFASEYFIPKQISFGDSTAEILVFAWDSQREMEGTMAKQNLRIMGTGRCASVQDEDGPRIRITGCEKKETGDLDFPDRVKLSLPNCLQIYVEDSKGGVLSAEGPDEGTTVEIAGVMDPFHPLPGIDELYQKSYQVTLDKQTFRPGSHLLKVSARDGYGNITLRRLQMDLTLDSSLNTVRAFNSPNPMKRNGTVFHFSTVMPSPVVEFGSQVDADRLEFEIRIFNQRGDLVKVLEKAISNQTSWDGRDRWGNLSANGVYFYNVTARQLFGDSDQIGRAHV